MHGLLRRVLKESNLFAINAQCGAFATKRMLKIVWFDADLQVLSTQRRHHRIDRMLRLRYPHSKLPSNTEALFLVLTHANREQHISSWSIDWWRPLQLTGLGVECRTARTLS